jgi:putative peptidoglycan lipid II flippase
MVLFMRGEFTQYEVLQVSYALFAYLSGLLSFMFIKVLAPGFYARQDTKTPVKIAIKAMVANMVFNMMLAPYFGYVGLAIATTLSATLNALMLYQGLKAANVFQLSGKTWWFISRLVSSAGIMALVVYQVSPDFYVWLAYSFTMQVTQLLICITSGIVSYLICLFLLGIRLSDIKIRQRTLN